MLIYLIAALPYIFTPYAFKVKIAKAIISDPGFMGQYHFTILSDWFTVPGVYLSRPLLALAYSIASAIILYKHFKLRKHANRLMRERFIHRWLITLFGFQLLLLVSHVFFLFGCFDIAHSSMELSEEVVNFTSSIGLIGLVLSPILFPRILYGLPNIPTNVPIVPDAVSDNPNADSTPVARKTPAYEEEYMLIITEKIDECMSKQQLYLQKDLNLSQLSVIINIPTHHLAYFFSGYMGMTFNDYRNVFRVEHAKRLIMDQKTTMITLEAVGLLSGFSNRNTFSRVFKEQEGMSPSAFAAQYSR